MSELLQSFLEKAESKASDKDHRNKLNFNISKYNDTVKKGVLQYDRIELAKQRAKNLKWKMIENLESALTEFESNFTKNGGKVIWAEDAGQAVKEIIDIIQSKNGKTVVKSKSMATEEIHLNEHLEKEDIKVYETDLGEYIQQLDGEPPYHIVTPAMHKSKEDVARLFHEKLGTPENATPRELTMIAREKLREQYVTADIGITGANFILPDVGGIAITENEGNARLTTTFPKTHIVIVGIEKVIPSMNDLFLYWPLLSTYGTGQQVTVFNSIFTGPRKPGETDGPEEMYVILMDNGRTNLLAEKDQREALYCIRCGACLNVCPVYKNIGGHTYNTTYSGPIGSVISPHFRGMENFKHLSFASSLCGNCTETCPVKINIHNLLVYNRRDSVKNGMAPKYERWGFYWWKKGMLNRKLLNMSNQKLKQSVFQYLFKNSWGNRRALPDFPSRSFNQQWRSGNKA